MAKAFMAGYKTYDTSNGYGSKKEWRQAFKHRMSLEEAEEIIHEQEQTPFAILEVSQSATQEEIKKSFRRLMMKWHPDHNKDNIEAAEAMTKKIIAAYTILTQ